MQALNVVISLCLIFGFVVNLSRANFSNNRNFGSRNPGRKTSSQIEDLEFILFDGFEHKEFHNVTLVRYRPKKFGQECLSSSYKELTVSTKNPTGIILDVDVHSCFPQTIANAAKNAGFSLLIWPTRFRTPGFHAKSIWLRKANSFSNEISIFEVSKASLETFLPTGNQGLLDFDKISPSKNQLSQNTWFYSQLPMYLLNTAIALQKIKIVLSKFLPHLSKNFRERRISTALAIMMVEFISSLVLIVTQVDFMGQYHIFPYPLWNALLSSLLLFSFITSFMLTNSLLKAEAHVSGVWYKNYRNIALQTVFVSFLCFFSVFVICIGWFLFYNDYLILGSLILFGTFKFCIHALFFTTKKRIVLRIIERNRNSSQKSKHEYFRLLNLINVSNSLFIFEEICILFAGIGFWQGSFEFTLLAVGILCISNSGYGICQVLSLPNVPNNSSNKNKLLTKEHAENENFVNKDVTSASRAHFW